MRTLCWIWTERRAAVQTGGVPLIRFVPTAAVIGTHIIVPYTCIHTADTAVVIPSSCSPRAFSSLTGGSDSLRVKTTYYKCLHARRRAESRQTIQYLGRTFVVHRAKCYPSTPHPIPSCYVYFNQNYHAIWRYYMFLWWWWRARETNEIIVI